MKPWRVVACVAALAVTTATAHAQAAPTVSDSCRGVAHNRSREFRDADGQPLTSPSVILVGYTLDNLGADLTNALVEVVLEGPTGIIRGSAALDESQRAVVAVPISRYGTYRRLETVLRGNGSTTTVDDAQVWGDPLVVDADEQSCDIDDLDAGTQPQDGTATTGAPTTVASRDDSGGGDNDWVWFIIAGVGVIAVIGGVLLVRADDCAELIAACEGARAEARAKAAAAEAATKAAAAAKAALDLALANTKALARAAASAAGPPPGSNSWVESEGKRISVYDVYLLNAAAATTWAKYKSGTATAQQAVAEWEHQAEPATLEQLRAADAAARAEQAGAANEALNAAKTQEAAAQRAADEAAAAVESSRQAAAAAAKAAEDACAEAKHCLDDALLDADSATPPEDPGLPPPDSEDVGLPPPDIPKHPPDDPVVPPKVGGDDVDKQPCYCGPDGTLEFLDMANWLLRLLRYECDINKIGAPNTTMGQTKDPVSQAIGEVIGWAKDAAGMIDPRRTYGMIWCFNNANNLDFWPAGIGDCGTCPDCNGTITFRGVCLPQHSFGDWMYGFAGGFFGLPDTIIEVGGHYAEMKKLFGPDGKYQKGQANEAGWGVIRLDPPVSQRCYRAGAALGRRLWDDKDSIIGDADFDDLVAAADKQANCPPCPDALPHPWVGRDARKNKFIN